MVFDDEGLVDVGFSFETLPHGSARARICKIAQSRETQPYDWHADACLDKDGSHRQLWLLNRGWWMLGIRDTPLPHKNILATRLSVSWLEIAEVSNHRGK
jgi:hypothetical protein